MRRDPRSPVAVTGVDPVNTRADAAPSVFSLGFRRTPARCQTQVSVHDNSSTRQDFAGIAAARNNLKVNGPSKACATVAQARRPSDRSSCPYRQERWLRDTAVSESLSAIITKETTMNLCKNLFAVLAIACSTAALTAQDELLVSAGGVASYTPETTVQVAGVEGQWNICPGEDGYVCDYLGVHKSRSGRLPLRSARYGALIFRSATGGWRAMTGRVVLRAGTTYNFRCNDTDFNNEGELTVTFQEVDR